LILRSFLAPERSKPRREPSVIVPLVSLLLLLALLLAYGLLEYALHLRALRRIPIRIHVNGSRGKSSVARLIAAGLRADGIPTAAKTTGSAARFIFPDGSEVPVRRWGPANIKEQMGVVRRAARLGSRALVVECMAIRPELGRVSERQLIRSTVGVITNVRPDHLDVMGPTLFHVAEALSQTIPQGGALFVSGEGWGEWFRDPARSRETSCRVVDVRNVTGEDLKGFRYLEHRENVALALAVCGHLGVERDRALEAMRAAPPDPGALRRFTIRFFEKELEFVNAFAANDPHSTLAIWERLGLRSSPDRPVLVLLHLRRDRARRGKQFARLVAGPVDADHVILVGESTDLVAKQVLGFGLPPQKLSDLGAVEPEEVFEKAFELTPARSVVVGIGNLVGRGERMVSYFENRRVVP
jgi:poly-gamma-glutamate synthase PgsB/CapB